ncbi:BAG family molecular chaperone regulator 2 isoform X1 [Anopheles arabiensis]|uniref:BAG domain-containing protein n=3 Tax=gambiae species complex TaxID=44542 RepID=A0A9I3LFS3_ANOME|nr:BAG family molecular chaperone regulator 2 isoform X1 [Anopheles arabiensis]XP_040165021.1 BAG family molecular chaperone regulator 2 isoform X1 [Anopheles arabiensis]XP_040165022.1 BAG family molecular chaperone regulator 2 isoform X1 [Anopheles arabiensis]XP_040165023.1 BAG family molecular chaperone regulator 2 isoform X1 [Anopheles arabiensis]XP_040232970.2 BAG family molecular chaperone regulator 2 isoform X1 [Anopheles coluzzii]XP_040232971.2 BAG family molecular chaperone regulator 2
MISAPVFGGTASSSGNRAATTGGTESMEVDMFVSDVMVGVMDAMGGGSGGAVASTSSEWPRSPRVDEAGSSWLNKPPMERFIDILDQLDTKVESLRKEAMVLRDKKDFLAMSVDLLKNNEYLSGLNENEREEIDCYVQRISSRLGTVELNVCTVRDQAQEDSLHHVNSLIDLIIASADPVISRQKCQQYLNACSTTDTSVYTDVDPHTVCTDKKFESVLLGCTLDDQKTIKKRLQALLVYLTQQTIVH